MKLFDAGVMLLIAIIIGFIAFSQEGCSFKAKELEIIPQEDLITEKV